MSREAPPPLPGGYTVGEKVFFTWESHTFYDGDKVVHGQQGEVVGPATAESHKGKGVKVRFPGNKGWVECCLNEVRRLRTAPAATPTPMRHTRDAAYVRPARAVLPQPGPNCKPLRRRQSWRGATANLTPLPLMNARR